MIRKILITSLIALCTAALLGCWFYFVGALSAEGRGQARCRQVEVRLLDSLESAIVDREEVRHWMESRTIGQVTEQINLDTLEQQILSRGEVMTAQVFAAGPQTVSVHITQRKPVVRFENGKGRWYADPEGYLFPVTHSVDVPVVTGKLPFSVDKAYRGETPENTRAWMAGIIELTRYIESKPQLQKEIGQIDIAPNGDIVLYTRTGGPAIIFGDSGDYVSKFRKLEAWWRNIAPQVEEGKTYQTINLKYNQQIICKQL